MFSLSLVARFVSNFSMFDKITPNAVSFQPLTYFLNDSKQNVNNVYYDLR